MFRYEYSLVNGKEGVYYSAMADNPSDAFGEIFDYLGNSLWCVMSEDGAYIDQRGYFEPNGDTSRVQ